MCNSAGVATLGTETRMLFFSSICQLLLLWEEEKKNPLLLRFLSLLFDSFESGFRCT